jgi:hypothetical protein
MSEAMIGGRIGHCIQLPGSSALEHFETVLMKMIA